MNLGMKPISYPSSSTKWTSCDRVPDQFPAGLRVLVVDDDPTCLRILEQMLRICLYEVTKCNRAEIALSLLRDNRTGYDIVISDVHMPDMDGFKLLEHVGLEMDLPVIMMSADDGKNVVMKGVTHGACDYLIKPVRMEALKNIWQHVVRKKKHEWKEKDRDQSGLSLEDGERNQKGSEDVDYSSSANDESWKSSKRRKDEEDDSEDGDDSSTLKKPRVVWSVDLHQQFVTAVNQLGIEKAVPKKILELMNVPGLTRENVASHLQKYRLYLRRLSGASPHQNGLGNSFIGSSDPFFGPINAFDFQALAASGQLPPQSLATIQVGAALGRAASKSNISPSLVDHRNIFSFENPSIRFLDGQQQNNNSKQPNLLHGIPTNMDSKQLVALHQSAQYQSNSLLTQMVQVQPQPHILSEINGSRVSNLPSISSANGPSYRSVSQPSNIVDFSSSPSALLSGNSFSLVSNSGMSKRQEVDSEIKGARGFVLNYDVFNGLTHRTQNWAGPTFDTTQHSVSSSVLVQPGFSSNQQSGQSRIPFVNSSPADNSSRIKSERLPGGVGFQNGLYPEQFGQEDLMSALLNQQQEMGPVENEFGYDGYQLDNLPV